MQKTSSFRLYKCVTAIGLTRETTKKGNDISLDWSNGKKKQEKIPTYSKPIVLPVSTQFAYFIFTWTEVKSLKMSTSCNQPQFSLAEI